MNSRASTRRTKREKRGRSNDATPETKEKKHPDPKVVNGILEFPLAPLKEHITCSICKGYLRSAHTISECLHSFCKSCLFCYYNQGNSNCPRCFVNLGPDPYPVTLFDRTLQELVDKILPELQVNDDNAEREFYHMKKIKPKPEFAADIKKETEMAAQAKSKADSESINDETGKESDPKKKTAGSPATRKNTRDESAKKIDFPVPLDEIDIELHPDESESFNRKRQRKRIRSSKESPNEELPALLKPLIRTSGKLKISQLKKYLGSQLNLDHDTQSKLVIRCNGDVVGDELSLTFILRTRWLTADEGMVLHYSTNLHI
jgi:hypothetical protein